MFVPALAPHSLGHFTLNVSPGFDEQSLAALSQYGVNLSNGMSAKKKNQNNEFFIRFHTRYLLL